MCGLKVVGQLECSLRCLLVDMGTYVSVDEDVPTCREDTLDTELRGL